MLVHLTRDCDDRLSIVLTAECVAVERMRTLAHQFGYVYGSNDEALKDYQTLYNTARVGDEIELTVMSGRIKVPTLQ